MSNSSEIPQIDPGLRARAARDFALYGAARLGLFLVLTVVIQGLAVLIDAPVPLAISALLALLVASIVVAAGALGFGLALGSA